MEAKIGICRIFITREWWNFERDIDRGVYFFLTRIAGWEMRQRNETKELWDEEKSDNWGLLLIIINKIIVGLMDPIKYNWPNFIRKNCSVQLA